MTRSWFRPLAVRGVLWRNLLDWAVVHILFRFRPPLHVLWTTIFFFFAAPARRAVVLNLGAIFPNSWHVTNYLRAWQTFYCFGCVIADGADFKINKTQFAYELVGAEAMQKLTQAKGAIVLTAHIGSYDLGAAVFAQRFNREIRMVRAPEPDAESHRHISASLAQSGEGGIKIDYNREDAMLSFDLLSALREGKIISIQGDRVLNRAATAPICLFGREAEVPSGPFALARLTGAPIFPLFVMRAASRSYKIVVHEPLIVPKSEAIDNDLAGPLKKWAEILERTIRESWKQWFAFTSFFKS